jgi:hypothetical protein
MTTIYKGTYSEVINLKNLLENSNISAFILNELMASIEPWAVTAGGLNPVSLSIHDEDFEKAKTTIDFFKQKNTNL